MSGQPSAKDANSGGTSHVGKPRLLCNAFWLLVIYNSGLAIPTIGSLGLGGLG